MMYKTKFESMQNATALTAYLQSLGLSATVITRFFNQCEVRSLDKIQAKVAFYQNFFRLDRATLVSFLTKFPGALSRDVDSDSPTSVKNKIQTLQNLLHTDLSTVTKMVITCPSLMGHDGLSDRPTALKAKLKDFQTVLHTDPATVVKIVTTCPFLLSFDVMGDQPTSVKNKLRFYQTMLRVDDQTLLHMIVRNPALLVYDVTGQGPTAMATKINKMTSVIPPERLRDYIVKNPNLLCVPAQSFKVRYLLADYIDAMPVFLSCGFLTTPGKVWARHRYLTQKSSVFKSSNVYRAESEFARSFRVKTADLMTRFPLDQTAVAQIEQTYLTKNGTRLTLDQPERVALGLE